MELLTTMGSGEGGRWESDRSSSNVHKFDKIIDYLLIDSLNLS